MWQLVNTYSTVLSSWKSRTGLVDSILTMYHVALPLAAGKKNQSKGTPLSNEAQAAHSKRINSLRDLLFDDQFLHDAAPSAPGEQVCQRRIPLIPTTDKSTSQPLSQGRNGVPTPG